MAETKEPTPDVPAPTSSNEETVDPTIPIGNAEQVTIKRHPFGLIALYIETIIGLVVAFGLVLFVVPQVVQSSNSHQAIQWIWTLAIVAGILASFFLLLATAVYRQNRWIVTDDSITQIVQLGLFRRQTSKLSMANVEDVTSEQTGFIATLLGFGTLKVETAGELSSFHFIYCPHPTTFAKIIIDAHERYINSGQSRSS